MNDVKKLRVLLTHWIEHNTEHAGEFRRWADIAGDVAPDILAAAERMGHVNQALATALEKLGGPVTYHQPGEHVHEV